MHLILTGATGLVGSATLAAMLASKEVSKITILSRRPVQMADDARDPRVNTIIHRDFTSYPEDLREKLRDATGCVWAVGISQFQKQGQEYIDITKTYPLAFANFLTSDPQPATKPFNFVYVSGHGVTHAPGFFTALQARVKGETELELAKLRAAHPLFRASAARPAVVDPTGHVIVDKYRPKYGVLRNAAEPLFYGLTRHVVTSFSAPTEPLGRALVQAAMGGWEGSEGTPGVWQKDGLVIAENEGWQALLKKHEGR